MVEEHVHVDEFDWCANLRQLRREGERLHESVHACSDWVWQNVVASDAIPRVVPEPLDRHLAAVHAAAARMGVLASGLFDQLCSEPFSRFLQGLPLTRAQYYLIRAVGADFGSAQALGLTPFEDFEVFEHLRYEDERWVGYINPSERPRDPAFSEVGARFGRPPEELSRSRLRPEQVAFFEEHLPTVLARFRG